MHISCLICPGNPSSILPFRMNINHFLVPPNLRLKLSYIAVRNSVSVCFSEVKEDELYDDRTELTDPSEWLSAR